MAVATSKTKEQFPLSPKKPLKKTVASTVGWIVLLLAIYVIAFYVFSRLGNTGAVVSPSFLGLFTLGSVVLLLILFFGNYWYETLYYKSYFYDLTDNFIVIRKGVILPKEITIPYERVQDVYVDQDIFDRMFHLYDVHLSTATIYSGMAAHIDGVEQQAAEGLRTLLLQTIHSKITNPQTTPSQNTNGQPN